MCVVVGAAAWPAPDPALLSSADAVRAASADLQVLAKSDARQAYQTRYLSAVHLPPAERAELKAVLDYQVNGLSTKPIIKKLRAVKPWLWAIDLDDYGWDRSTYGALASGKNADPYFHVVALDATGGKIAAGASWLPAPDLAYLIQVTGSQSPVLRADWFLYRTAIQEGRNDAGYYDFLKLKSRKDAENLAKLRRKDAEDAFRKQAAVIEQSGVALQGRQFFRYATISGSWWETRDTKGDFEGADQRNPIRNLQDDYKHDAEEIVFTLPNRLPAYYLSDDKGVGVASAPPDIAADSKSPTNDKRVHAGLSCIRCHSGAGLIQFDDLFRGRFDKSLRAADKDREQRLQSEYLGPIQKGFDRDRADYADAVEEACGLTPAGLSSAFQRQWARYADESVDNARAAQECGVSEEELVRAVRVYAAAQTRSSGVTDPVIALMASANPRPMRRSNFEQIFPIIMLALGASK